MSVSPFQPEHLLLVLHGPRPEHLPVLSWPHCQQGGGELSVEKRHGAQVLKHPMASWGPIGYDTSPVLVVLTLVAREREEEGPSKQEGFEGC